MIKELKPEQVRNWNLPLKDQWWLDNVYRGSMPQLTLRSAATGMVLGAVLSLTNLYVGIKTGWALGVGITSVILSFALWKLLAKLGIGQEMTILENNAMQSIATAAGYMTGPLIGSMGAYMIITGQMIPLWQMVTWMIGLSLLGVLFAFPLKKKFINDEQHPFPEGRACGYVMEGLHSDDVREGRTKTRLLMAFGGLSVLWQALGQYDLLAKAKLGFLSLPYWLGHALNSTVFSLKLAGTKLGNLTVAVETDIVMYAVGGLIGIRTGVSLIIGAVANYLIIVPVLIDAGVITGGEAGIGFKQITMWSLWGGVAMMTTASLWSFFAKPKMILSAFSGIFGGKKSADVLAHIELPMKVFAIGIPLVGLAVVLMGKFYFGVHFWLGVIAIPLVFIFTLIAVNSTALTSITPTGPLGKLTQLTYAVLSPGNITTNLATGSIVGEVAGNASNLLMDIKPGFMLGAKPRHQAMGHVLGIIAGAAVCPWVFYNMIDYNIKNMLTEQMPMPAVQIWKGVAEVLTQGFSALHPTAIWAMAIGALLGILFEVIRTVTRGRFFLSGVGMGLAFVVPFSVCLAMFLGALFFWVVGRSVDHLDESHSWWKRVGIPNTETICAGIIAGGAILGIIAMIIVARLG